MASDDQGNANVATEKSEEEMEAIKAAREARK